MSHAGPSGFRAPLRRSDFRLLWLAQMISDLGDGLTTLALMLLALKLTGSPVAVAATLIALELPQVTIGLAAGVFVDRWERRRIMLVSDSLRAMVVLGFVVVDSESRLWLLFVLALAQASVGTFFSPARMAFVAAVLPADELFPANSLTQLTRVLSTVLGSTAAGLLVGLSGQYWPAFVFDAVTFVASVALVSRVRARSQPAGSRATAGLSVELRQGLVFIAQSPALLATLIATSTALLGIGAVNVLWVPLFTNDLHVPTAFFGAADLAQVSAIILGAGLSVRLVSAIGAPGTVTGCLAALGAAVALLAGVGTFWQVLVLLFAIGWIVSPLNAAITTIVQTSVTDDMRGRAAAALGTVNSSATIASMGLSGVVAALVGVRGSFVLAGGVIALSAAVALLLFRRRAADQPIRTVEGRPDSVVNTDLPAPTSCALRAPARRRLRRRSESASSGCASRPGA